MSSDAIPKISVILPTYNRAALLARALRSALSQTYGAFEVRVVDDGSSDGTQSMVAALDDPRICYLRIDHAGPAAARNHGIRAAQGEWIAFLDSDDEWKPEKLQRQMEAVAGLPSGVGVVYTGAEYIDDDTGSVSALRRPPGGPVMRVFEQLLETNWFPFVSVVARRRCFDVVGLLDETLTSGEDREWLLRAARRFDFFGLAEPLVRVHVHRGQRQSEDLEARIAFAEAILHRYAVDLERRPRVRARKNVSLGQLRLRAGDMAGARRAFVDAMRVRPTFVPAYVHFVSSWGPWSAWHAVSRWRRHRQERRALSRIGGQRSVS